MTFTRTNHGIKNTPAFLECDLLVFIEGKNKNCPGDWPTFDERYYQALFGTITNKRVKIRVLGNWIEVYDQAKKTPEDATNIICIIDKDYSRIQYSRIPQINLFYTYAYSWENEFWTTPLCEQIINDLTISNSILLEAFIDAFTISAERLRKICFLSMIALIDDINLIRNNRRSYGVNMEGSCPEVIPREELQRFFDKFNAEVPKSDMLKIVFKSSFKLPSSHIIQGHLWENFCVTIISKIFKQFTRSNSTNHEMIKSIAFSKFIKNPSYFLSTACLSHYTSRLSHLL